VGGPHTSVGIDMIPEYVDHILIGEGESSILELIEDTGNQRVVYGKQINDMDLLPFPAWEEFIWRPYDWTYPLVDRNPVFTFNTSRGCPFECSFCSVNAIWGRKYRYMSAERIAYDIGYMKKYYGLGCAYFREDHFTLNKKRTIQFCELLLKKNLNIDWICETRVDDFDDESFVQLMARSGCKAIYVGVESGSPRMLKLFKKGETTEQFIKAFDLARRLGIRTYASFVVGAPTEIDYDLHQTFELIDRISPDSYSMNIYIGLPGSELYDYIIDNDLYE